MKTVYATYFETRHGGWRLTIIDQLLAQQVLIDLDNDAYVLEITLDDHYLLQLNRFVPHGYDETQFDLLTLNQIKLIPYESHTLRRRFIKTTLFSIGENIDVEDNST